MRSSIPRKYLAVSLFLCLTLLFPLHWFPHTSVAEASCQNSGTVGNAWDQAQAAVQDFMKTMQDGIKDQKTQLQKVLKNEQACQNQKQAAMKKAQKQCKAKNKKKAEMPSLLASLGSFTINSASLFAQVDGNGGITAAIGRNIHAVSGD